MIAMSVLDNMIKERFGKNEIRCDYNVRRVLKADGRPQEEIDTIITFLDKFGFITC